MMEGNNNKQWETAKDTNNGLFFLYFVPSLSHICHTGFVAFPLQVLVIRLLWAYHWNKVGIITSYFIVTFVITPTAATLPLLLYNIPLHTRRLIISSSISRYLLLLLLLLLLFRK